MHRSVCESVHSDLGHMDTVEHTGITECAGNAARWHRMVLVFATGRIKDDF